MNGQWTLIVLTARIHVYDMNARMFLHMPDGNSGDSFGHVHPTSN